MTISSHNYLRYLFALCCSMLGIGLISGSLWAQTASVGQRMQKGMLAFEQQDYPGALQHFTAVIRQDPYYAYVFAYRGNTHFALERYQEALADYSTELEHFTDARKRNAAALQKDNLVVYGIAQMSSQQAAMLYNNRGTARYFLGDQRGAIRDFQDALRLAPGLTTARRNLDLAINNRPIPKTRPTPNPLSGNKQESMAYADFCARPSSFNYGGYSFSEDESGNADPAELRYQRGLHQGIVDPKLKDRLGNKAFDIRKIPKKGLIYNSPVVGGQSQSYLQIKSVKISTRATFVTLSLQNESGSAISVCIDDPRGEGAFYLTDRSGRSTTRLRYRRVNGIDVYPSSTKVAAGGEITMVLEFPRIPNTWGFMNLIEGSRQDGQAWNFYDIDLTTN